MNKEKILGLSNTDDVMWYKLSPGDETLKQIDLIFDIYDNLYEACEHFESASRYYNAYFKSNDYYNSDYETGGIEIDTMNEKIILHDEAVKKYNSKLAEIHVELNKYVKTL